MKKYLLKTISFLLLFNIAIAQTKKEQKEQKDYIERSQYLQKFMWSSVNIPFEVTSVPEKYKNESAVIIAKSIDIDADDIFYYSTTIRQRVLIQDKAALLEYSTLNFKDIKNNSVLNWKDWAHTYFYKIYVGAKIIKPDGKVIIVNTIDEAALTQNNFKGKEAVIAIPNLQVGDIIDYYYLIEEGNTTRLEIQGPAIYFLASVHPILYYNVEYDLIKTASADILAVNGAKEIKDSTTDKGHIVIHFTERDVAKIGNNIWTSLAREIPYYIIRFGYPKAADYHRNGIRKMAATSGEVEKGPYSEALKKDIKIQYYTAARTCDKSPYKNMKDYFGGKNNSKDAPVDSIANFYYNYYRWAAYGNFNDMNVSNERNYLRMNPFYAPCAFTEMLKLSNINSDIVVVCDRFSQRLKDAFSPDDYDVLVRVNDGSKLKWFCFNSFFQDDGQLSYNYQGEHALLLTRDIAGRLAKFKDTEEPIVLPISTSSENVSTENLKINFDKENLQLISIDRNCKKIGSMKQDDQENLLLAEDVQANFSAFIGMEKSVDLLAEKKDTRVLSANIQNAMDEERTKQKDHFKSEINDQYGQDAKELISYKINNNGLSLASPMFDFSEQFTMENFVQKAGNNFIFDIGKLMGSYTKVDQKDVARTLDIYMTNARTIAYNFSIIMPDGYTVKGIERLNKKVENDISSFVSTAKIDGNTIMVTATRIYKNNFEPASNWPKLVNIINASADFTNEKLLLQKK